MYFITSKDVANLLEISHKKACRYVYSAIQNYKYDFARPFEIGYNKDAISDIKEFYYKYFYINKKGKAKFCYLLSRNGCGNLYKYLPKSKRDKFLRDITNIYNMNKSTIINQP